MKTIRLILLQLLFFFLMSIVAQSLDEQLFIKWVCYSVLISALTYLLYKYFTKLEYILNGFLINLFSLFILFELKKFVEYSLGLKSPKYTEVVFTSMLFSFIGIAIYLGGIVFANYLKKFILKKEVNK